MMPTTITDCGLQNLTTCPAFPRAQPRSCFRRLDELDKAMRAREESIYHIGIVAGRTVVECPA